MERAVILGTELPRAISVIRSLGRAGIRVVTIDHRLRMPGAYSRYVSESFHESHNGTGKQLSNDSRTDWVFDPSAAMESLLKVGKEGGGVLIPTNSDYLVLAAKNYKELSKYFIMTHPPWDIMDKMIDNVKFYTFAEKAGISIPKYYTPKSLSDLNQTISKLDFTKDDYLLKMDVWAPGPTDPSSGAFTRPAGRDANSLKQRYLEVVNRTGWYPIIQEVIPGEVDNCIGVSMVAAKNFEPVVIYCVKRLKLYTYSREEGFKHPYELGANVYSESTYNSEAMESAKKLIKEAKYYGPVTVEFRKNSNTGELKLLKADARVVNATSLSTSLGLDIPLAIYNTFIGKEIKYPINYPEGIAWLWEDRYFRTLLKNRHITPVRKQLLDVLKRIYRIRAFGFLSLRDYKPLVRTLKKEFNWQMNKRNSA